jgi:hypothetical protein
MKSHSESSASEPVLLKWRFFPSQKDETTGAVTYWWSDGSKSQVNGISYLDSIADLKDVQNRGGVKSVP